MKKVLKTILMGAVAFSLAMGVGCGTGENSSLEKESSKAEDSSSQNKRRQLRDKSDYGKVIALTFDDGPNTCLLYTYPRQRDVEESRMQSSA